MRDPSTTIKQLQQERERLAQRQQALNSAFNDARISAKAYVFLSRQAARGLPHDEYANMLEQHIAHRTRELHLEKAYRHKFKTSLPSALLLGAIALLVIMSTGLELSAMVTYSPGGAGAPFSPFSWSKTIGSLTTSLGKDITLNASRFVANPSGSHLRYAAKDVTGIAAFVDGDVITFTPEAEGIYEEYVIASDGITKSQSGTFMLRVVRPRPHVQLDIPEEEGTNQS